MSECICILPIRYYAIGHSYLLHGPFEGWQTKGQWGMAASSPESDYFHRVQARLRESISCSVEAIAENYATYERLCTVDATRHSYINSEQYARMRDQIINYRPNLITIYIGGGNTIANDEDSLSLFYHTLYSMVAENKLPETVVICPCSNRKTLFAMEIARQYGFIPVDLMMLHTGGKSASNPYYAIGQYPQYDAAVKAGAIEFRTHPSDAGHDRIAEEIVNAAIPMLEKLPKTQVSLPDRISINSPAVIAEQDAKVALSVEVEPVECDNAVLWSVDNDNLASITRDGVLTVKNNGVVTVSARSLSKTEIFAQESIIISGQKPWYKLTYLPGTDEMVERIPEPVHYLKGTISLRASGAAYLPMRRGYQFIGWSDVTQGTGSDLIDEITMDKDRIVQANWRIADRWDFDTMFDSAGVRMGGFNVRYIDSIAKVSSAPGTGLSVYYDQLQLSMTVYKRFFVRMQLDCEAESVMVTLRIATTQGEFLHNVRIPANTMLAFSVDLPLADGVIEGFRIEPQMTDCCAYVDCIAFEK